MKMLVSILLLCMVVCGALLLRDPGIDQRTITALSIGFLMLGAWLTGRLFAGIKLPRISGYLLFGMLVGPSLWALGAESLLPAVVLEKLQRGTPLISSAQVIDLRFIKYLAISLIAITAGGEIHLDWLLKQGKRIAALTLANVLGVGVLVFGVCWALHGVLPVIRTDEAMTTMQLVIAYGFLGLIASGNSPSVAIALINECRADGPLSRTTLAVTVCKDLTIIVFFAALISVGKGLLDEQTAISATFLLAVGAQLGGSILLGALLGLVMAWFVEHVRGHLVFFVVVSCFLFALLGEQKFHMPGTDQHIHLEPLLMALAAGLTMRNFRPKRSEPLFKTIEEMSLPVYCLFFAVAGAELDLSVFAVASAALAAGIVVTVRAVGVWAVVTWTGKRLGLEPEWRGKLWLALTPQAGVTLALATLVVQSFAGSPWAGALGNLLLGLVAVHAMAGPIAYRWALVSSGEAGKMAKSGSIGH